MTTAPDVDQLGLDYEATLSEEERRRLGSHYTPRELCERIVERSLEPLLATMGPDPSEILQLQVCDPAMGCGAFLLAACRSLAQRLVSAWAGEGSLARVRDEHGSPQVHARRLVTRHCLYGVDKDPVAVELARRSLWLEVGDPDEPRSYVERSLRCGDALLGLSEAQRRHMDWAPSPDADGEGPPPGMDASRARLVGDVLLGAFFAHARDGARRRELARRAQALSAWLGRPASAPPTHELERWAGQLREHHRPLHWDLELPELLDPSRPLVVVGNPPFMGKNAITESAGPGYVEWLQTLHPGAHGNADLSAHFLRRAATLVGDHGTIGIITTNTIAQGDTRASGLGVLLREGWEIYDATPSMPWPGDANVSVAVTHLARGAAVGRCEPRLSGRVVPSIDSRLRPVRERPEPARLRDNQGKGFVGSYVLGMGFVLTPKERDALVARDPRNAERIKPYLGGAELNRSPTRSFDRHVIDFEELSLPQARAWPALLEIVERGVKPQRARNNREAYRKYWWQFGEKRPALYRALRSLRRCLVTARVSKHLCVSFRPVGWVFSEQLVVFALDRHAHLALLQSRVHETWARRLSSSLEDRLRYSVSACFETFPVPEAIDGLEAIGEQLDRARSELMTRTERGLTKLYNALRDPRVIDPELAQLRELHEALDRAVLSAYGWSDVEVPPFVEPTTAAETELTRRFEDEVFERLLALNGERA